MPINISPTTVNPTAASCLLINFSFKNLIARITVNAGYIDETGVTSEALPKLNANKKRNEPVKEIAAPTIVDIYFL